MQEPRTIDLEGELAALERARQAVEDKLEKLAGISGGGADAMADEYIDAVVAGTIDKLQHELVVFGRIDDEHAWRVGLYGIDSGGEQLVIDWRARVRRGVLPGRLRRSPRPRTAGQLRRLHRRPVHRGVRYRGGRPARRRCMAELSRSRGARCGRRWRRCSPSRTASCASTPTARLVLRGGPGTGKTVVGLHRAAWLVYNDRRVTADRILVVGPSDGSSSSCRRCCPPSARPASSRPRSTDCSARRAEAGSDERWLDVLDRFEAALCQPAEVKVGHRRALRGRRDRAGRPHRRRAPCRGATGARCSSRRWRPASRCRAGEVERCGGGRCGPA